ncbi:MAG TPA: hypothetical protein VNV17_12585 [Solirubrobacteraceae bacterium]|jgi:hypothetical protein|nr:hypothetical protein [Solirubrobacteraceae bacterium]
MADLVTVKWYSTVFRKDAFAADVASVAPLALRYGATQYSVHVDNDDRYRVTQFTWVASKDDWYRYWDGPEMIEFRARNMGRYQVPIAYSWADEIAFGALGPEVPNGQPNGAPEPSPAPATPQVA